MGIMSWDPYAGFTSPSFADSSYACYRLVVTASIPADSLLVRGACPTDYAPWHPSPSGWFLQPIENHGLDVELVGLDA